MIIAIVNFPLPKSMSRDEFYALMVQTVPRFRGKRGLRRKHYLYDAERHFGGGVYLFTSRADADACFSESFVRQVTAAFGPPEIRYVDALLVIDNEADTVTDLRAA
jgi:hypothetical protein